MRDIKIAADAGDVEGIRERVDVPAVKESLKEQLTSMMQQKLTNDSELKSNPFGGLGMLFAGKMVETMVDAAVTPTHLVALIRGDRTKAFARDGEPTKEETSESLDSKADLEGSFNSTDRYTLKVLDKETHKQTVALTMHRDGLSWRLTSIQLPTEELLAKD
ncbi:DUF2939 domain-containing protein [Hymenobacter arcticus]